MLYPVNHFTWQALRTLKRSRRPLTGKELRVSPSPRTKDGTFLDELVSLGLLRVVGEEPVTDENKKWRPQFRKRYALTEKGEQAAEYGEYEREPRSGKR